MKKTLVMTCTLLALAAGMASAAGVNLSWSECGLGGIDNMVFGCTTNTGLPNLLVGSVVPPATATEVNGMVGIVDLQTAGATLSAWWDVGTPGCRANAVSASYNAAGEGLGICQDYFGDRAAALLPLFGISTPSTSPASSGPNRVRFKFACAVAAGAGPLTAEAYVFVGKVGHAKTVGTPSCAGCQDAACLVLNEVEIDQTNAAGNLHVFNAANRNFVTWQGGLIGGNGCPDATPTHNRTWGEIKSLYR